MFNFFINLTYYISKTQMESNRNFNIDEVLSECYNEIEKETAM